MVWRTAARADGDACASLVMETSPLFFNQWGHASYDCKREDLDVQVPDRQHSREPNSLTKSTKRKWEMPKVANPSSTPNFTGNLDAFYATYATSKMLNSCLTAFVANQILGDRNHWWHVPSLCRASAISEIEKRTAASSSSPPCARLLTQCSAWHEGNQVLNCFKTLQSWLQWSGI